MRTIVGVLLLILSFIGTIFFRRYNGSVIPYPTLWYISFILLGIFGAWLVFSSYRKTNKIVEQIYDTEIEKLKSNAEKIELNFDNCEFKSGSFSHQVEDENMKAVKLFAPGSLAYVDTTVTENVIQSYLTYVDTIDETPCKFISQSFPFDPTTLKFYVLRHNITLYVDKFDRNKYYFDLQR